MGRSRFVLALQGFALALSACQGFPGVPTCETAADCDSTGRYTCSAEGKCELPPDGRLPPTADALGGDSTVDPPDAAPTPTDAMAPGADATDAPSSADFATADAPVTPPADALVPPSDALIPLADTRVAPGDAAAPASDAAAPPLDGAPAPGEDAAPLTPDLEVPPTADAAPPTPDVAPPPLPDAFVEPPDFGPFDACADPISVVSCRIEGNRPECVQGFFACDGNVTVCRPAGQDTDVCDGLDNDCDGSVDNDLEDDPAIRQTCFEGAAGLRGIGACVDGETACVDGDVVCVGQTLPDVEVCDGADNDCNGETDERSPEACADCVVPDADGICAAGVRICVEGVLQCFSALAEPEPGTDAECDLADNDCDGRFDEASEAESVPVASDAVLAQCPDRVRAPWDGHVVGFGACDEGDPGEVGCGPVHACLEPDCLLACREARTAGQGACEAACAGGDREPCTGDCLLATVAAFDTCAEACAPFAGGSRFSCQGGAGGPTCVPTECPPGAELRHDVCRRIEICNNGLDEDEDGLVDGTVDLPFERCTVHIPALTEAEEVHWGYCDADAQNRGVPGCDDSLTLSRAPGDDDERCFGDLCPKVATLSYDFAVDKEEVSNRAYWQCVESGCCRPPSGARYAIAAADLAAGRAAPRPEAPARCEAAPFIDGSGQTPEPLAPDLPASGVSWCQARDFCAWAGKRLLTDLEWERAAAGPYPQRTAYAWGDDRPGDCEETQCCHGEGWAPGLPVPVGCDPDHFYLCPPGTPQPGGIDTRHVCLGMWDAYNPECIPRGNQANGAVGPAPVYANEDGATPTGILNLNTNVHEWVYDWKYDRLEPRVEVDPIGPGCMEAGSIDLKSLRGGTYTSVVGRFATQNRAGLMPGVHLSTIGFRCGRSLATDAEDRQTLCTSEVPGAPDVCRPDREMPACPGPDLDSPEESGACLLGARRHLQTCEEGVPAECFSAEPFDCTSLNVSEITLNPQSIQGKLLLLQSLGIAVPAALLDLPRTSIITDALVSDSLANGGRTRMVVDVACNVGQAGQTTQARLVNAVDEDGGLREIGRVDDADGSCDIPPSTTFPLVVRRDSPLRFDNFCSNTIGHFNVRALGLDLNYSGVMLYDTFRVSNNPPFEVYGNYMILVTKADARASYLGAVTGDSVPDLFASFGVPITDLCFLETVATALSNPLIAQAAGGNWSCGAWQQRPGCDLQTHTCLDPELCTGYLLPFSFRAEEPVSGKLGNNECICP